MKTKNPNALNKMADSTMSHSKLATLVANLLREGCSLSRSIKLTKTIVLSFIGLALITAGLTVGITAAAKKGEAQLRSASADTSAVAPASTNSFINKVALIKAGTGLAGEGGSNNTVLINNSAKWRVALNLSTGTATITMEFPNGNVIDSASVSSAAGCVDGSKVEKINGSYTNNKATCVIKADSPKSQNWDITDYVFGGNGQRLAPTKVTVNGQNYTGTIPSVTLKGKANYKTFIGDYGSSLTKKPGYVTFGLSVYIQAADKSAPIGLEPLSDTVKLSVDMSSLPSDWKIAYTSGMGHINLEGLGDTANRILSRGNWTPIKSADGKRLELTVKNTAIGYRHFPTKNNYGDILNTFWATYAYQTIYISVPLKSLSVNGQNYQLKTLDSVASTIDGAQTAQIRGGSSVGMWLSSRINGHVNLWVAPSSVLGHDDYWNEDTLPVYPGESYKTDPVVAFVNTTDTPNTNVNSCMAWDGRYTEPDGDGTPKLINNNITGNLWAQYGVVSSDGVPNTRTDCGVVGDSKANFFNTMAEAKAYAAKKGGYVNAIRFHGDKAVLGEYDVAYYPLRIKSNTPVGTSVKHSLYVSTNEWQLADPATLSLVVVPGKILPELKLSNNSTTSPDAKPNEIEHLAITPYAYAADTNVKAIVTLPADISPVGGSYKYNGNKLTPTSVVKNTDGTTTITLPLGTVGSKDAVNAKQPDITMDAVVSPTIVTPASKTITVAMSGDGTDKMQYGWRSRSATFSVSNIIVNYGYNMSQSSADLLPGDTQTYNYTTYNNPDNPSANPSMKTISVLPYNGDNRGTTNVAYTPDKLALNVAKDSSGVETGTNNLKLFYTTDQSIRENTRETDATVNWTEIPVSSAKVVTLAGTINPDGTTATEGKGYDLPKDVTAIKWVDTSTAKGRLVSVSLTLRNISSTGDNAKLASNIALVKVSNGPNAADQYELQNQETKIATVEPTTVSLAIDSQSLDLSHQVTADGADFAKTTSVLTTKTNNAYGYNLTMQAVKSNSLINQTSNSHQINSVAIGGGQAVATLASGTWGYALPGNTTQGFGDVNSYSTLTKTSKFKSIPGSAAAVLNVTRTRPNQITGDQTSVLYGANLTGRASGVYRADIVYTAVANPFK